MQTQLPTYQEGDSADASLISAALDAPAVSPDGDELVAAARAARGH